jgi:hypothetical protein
MHFIAEQPETFWTLLHDSSHWEFEFFLMVLFDGVLAGLCWPLLKRAVRAHDARRHKPCDHE